VFKEVIDVDLGDFLGEDTDDFFTDGLDLGSLGVGGLLNLLGVLLGEGDGEHSDDVPVVGLDVDVGLDDVLPLSDELA